MLLVAHALFMSNYKGCQLPLDIMMVILFGSLIWTRFFLWLYSKGCLRVLAVIAVVFGTVVCVLSTTSSLVFLILIEVHYAKCMPLNLKVFDWVIVGTGNFLVVLAVLVLIALGVQRRQRQADEEEEQRTADIVYERICDPTFDAYAYVTSKGNHLDKTPLSKKEKAIFEDACLAVFTEDNTSIEEDHRQECTICIADFLKGQKVVRHPVCCHYFHAACIKPWLEQNLHCPLCKRGTRSSLILHLSKQLQGKQSLATASNL